MSLDPPGTNPDHDELPRVLPPTWKLVDVVQDGAAYMHRGGLKVIASVATHGGARWLHVSCSRRSRLPTWDDLRMVKNLFVGRHRKAIQVFPAETEHVNIHPYCLHLWCCLDVDPLPDFRGGTGMI